MRVRATGWTLVIIGGLAFSGILLALLVLLNADCGFVGCTGTTPWGWIVPLVAGVVLGLVVVLLLDGEDLTDESKSRELKSSSCASCGSAIIDEWRMCPDCGELLECDMEIPGAELGDTI